MALGRTAGAAAVFPHGREVGAGGTGVAVVVNFYLDTTAIPADDFGIRGAFAAFAVQGFATDDVGHRFFGFSGVWFRRLRFLGVCLLNPSAAIVLLRLGWP